MRWGVGLLLLGAAVLKTVQLATEPSLPEHGVVGTLAATAQIAVEFGLGLVALSGLYWSRVRQIALALFTCFAIYSLYQAISGATSCGCFGPLMVHPWWTFSLDLAVLVGLMTSLRREGAPKSDPPHVRGIGWQSAATALMTVLAVGTTALLVRQASSRTAIADGVVTMAGNLTILEPAEWIGKPFPIANSINLDLFNGKWTVLFHRHDCPACQEAVPKYEEMAEHATVERVAIVEVPPYGELTGHADEHHARLSDDREWFVQTPVEIRLTDGIVTSASHELPSLLTASEQ